MYIVKSYLEHEYIIKNSRFITLIYQVRKKDDVIKHLKEAKKKYPKATHYTYAYKIADETKAYDDGEPGGTAGMPILNVIKKREMDYILVIIVRYFGGIKLGAGGLVRAYSNSCNDALEKAELRTLVPAKKIKITTTYDKGKELDYLLRKSTILEKNFTDVITYTLLLEDEHILDNQFSYEVIGTDYIEKEY